MVRQPRREFFKQAGQLTLGATLFRAFRADAAAAEGEVFLLPYFLRNGETGVYLTYSRDGFKFDWLNDGKPILPAPTMAGPSFVP